VHSQFIRADIDPTPTATTRPLHVLAAVSATTLSATALSTANGSTHEQAAKIPLDTLEPADSPRSDGISAEHVRSLAEAEAELPPILVQRSTRRVIDGMHRLAAARQRGESVIQARFVDCTAEDAFVLAVATNISGGLPLPSADRRAAAARIMRQRPEASDRLIAELAGLTPKVVGGIRRQASETLPNPARRMGRDGRLRPLNPSDGRRIASQILEADPDASLREIAKRAGISIGTAHDVREKIRRGSDPISPKSRTCSHCGTTSRSTPVADDNVDFDLILRRLRRDPALRYSQSGRALLAWLSSPRLLSPEDWQEIAATIPPHCSFDIIQIARGCAQVWSEFATELAKRNR
jgi:ParB-like chromosome segregation protein Spo0J